MENEIQSNHLQTQTPTPVSNSPSTNRSKILFITVFVLVVVAGSVYIGVQIGKTQTPNQTPIVAQPTALPTQTTVNPTADWKTYSSSLYSYSVKYPLDWQTGETKHNAASIIDPSNFKLMTELTNSKSGIKIFYEGDFDHGFEPWVFKNSEMVNIGGKEATKITLTLEGNPNEWMIYTIEDFYNFRIEVNVTPSDKNLVDQILSTFEFSN